MPLDQFLALITRATYLLIAAITLVDFLARRDRTRLDIALMFLSLAVNVLIQEYAVLIGAPPPWLTAVSQIALMSQPFLLMRLVTHFRPLTMRVQQIALAGLLVVIALLVFVGNPLPAWAALFMVAYFAWAEGYATLAFIRGALTTGGVTRWRHALAALGSGLVAAVIVVAGVLLVLPDLSDFSRYISQPMGLASGLAYYFAFAPPRWLRQVWQLTELQRYLRGASGKPARERAAHSLPFLCETAQRALGGRAALAAMHVDAAQPLRIQASTVPALLDQSVVAAGGAIGLAWTEQRPAVANEPQELSAAGARLASAVGAEALCAVPIATPERRWGLLVVLLQRRPLFPEDDLELMRLLSEQTALALEQQALLDEQQGLVEDLRRRTSQLEAANRELEAFSYSVSHDLRAPLRHIEGFTDLLLRGGADEGQRAHLQRISAAAVRMGRLIDDLLTFSRMGRAEVKSRTVRIDLLVEEARHELQTEADGREIEWLVHSLPEVQGDPDLLRLVLINLVSNALKYTRGRRPARIEIGAEPASSQEVLIYVRDNGVGFDMRYADKLFGVFQRLHHTHEFEGVGIGLANVRRIVHRHGGRTWAHGQMDAGATFYFTLPVRGRESFPAPAIASSPAALRPDATGGAAHERA